ncbi:GntR family transcriptional regulator [Leifsonia sp. NPDC080035]|uniref:GntR family transcriptional regulator n=1 Tax=Leifsonia sp. NPDC080035 TaxID=3143936 RepID=A0AAU7GJE7_9MICO
MPVPVTEAVSPRRLIRDEVFQRLLDAIVDGDLTPGEQLYDAEIEKWVGVSRTPVREALNQLAAMGLVEIMPQKRTRVTPIDPARLRELVATVATLLHGTVRDATPLLTEQDAKTLRSAADAVARAKDGAARANDAFITEALLGVFVRRLDNRSLARLLARHLPEVRRALLAAPSAAAFEKAAPAVAALVDAVDAGDAGRAARAVDDYWNTGLVAVADEFAALERTA